MLVIPASFRAPMARLRQVAMVRGALPVRSWEASSAKGGVSHVVQGLDLPVVSDQGGELGRDGLLCGEAGDGVDRLDGGLAGLAVGAAALDLDGLAGTREEQVVHGGDLDAPDLIAAVAGVAGPSLERDLPPGKGFELVPQVLLVALDDDDVVGAARQEVGGVFALGVQGVGGDDRPGEVGDGVRPGRVALRVDRAGRGPERAVPAAPGTSSGATA